MSARAASESSSDLRDSSYPKEISPFKRNTDRQPKLFQASKTAKKPVRTMPPYLPAPPIDNIPSEIRVLSRKWSKSAPVSRPMTPA